MHSAKPVRGVLRALAAGTLLACLLMALAACMNYSKRCFDGVCEITKNGKTYYEGDPDKIAAIKAKKQGQADKKAELQQRYDAAPRRKADEPVHVAVAVPTAGNQEIAQHVGAIYTMLKEELGQGARLVLVTDSQVQGLLQQAAKGDSGGMSSRKKASLPAKVTPELAEKLRLMGLAADVIVLTHLAPKKQTGFVRGGGGKGMVQVERIEIQGSVSSLYNFKEYGFSQVGKSTSSFSAAGFDKKGQAKSGEMKLKRKLQKDLPAVQAYAAGISTSISEEIRPTLPSLAAAEEIRQELQEQRKNAVMNSLKSAFGK